MLITLNTTETVEYSSKYLNFILTIILRILKLDLFLLTSSIINLIVCYLYQALNTKQLISHPKKSIYQSYTYKSINFQVVQMFKGCKCEDMPPHIYAMAQSAYRGMLATRRDHSLVFLGRSGGGKTTNFKNALHYLVMAAGAVNKILTVEKLNAVFTVLEAFGNSRTHMNSNATRFTQLFSLDFDQSGQIASASLQVILRGRNCSVGSLWNMHIEF